MVLGRVDPERRVEAVERMCRLQAHRGPDSAGVRDLGFATVGTQRLQVIGPTPAGDQPLSNEDGTVWVVANGEIYNYLELREELRGRGHRFVSDTDIEVLVHLWEELGQAMLPRLRGMFGFAIVDTRRRCALLARDRLGIKPLYHATVDGTVVFASELKAITGSGLVRPELESEMVDSYLTFGCVPGPQTMLRGVRSLAPGHAMLLHGEEADERCWWDLPAERSREAGPTSSSEEVRDLLERSIVRHARSDRPLGAFLSGGIDSTAVVGLLSKVTNEPVRTFNVTFADTPASFDESRYARDVAGRFAARHTEVVVSGSDVREQLARVVWHLDQPSADGINSWFVSQAAAASGLIVALSGLGGDELFGGYGTYRWVPRLWRAASGWGHAPDCAHAGARHLLGAIATYRRSSGRWHKLQRLADVDSPLSLYALARTLLSRGEREQLYAPALAERFRGRDDGLRALRDYARPGESAWRTVTRLELRNYMGNRLLRDTDTMSMAHSLEVRVPLLDDDLVEFVTAIDAPSLGREPKPLLVRALGNVLPAEVVRRPKQGFSFPMAHWMRGELRNVVDDALSPDAVRARGLFDPGAVRRLVQRFVDHRQEYQAVWQLVILELWARAHVD